VPKASLVSVVEDDQFFRESMRRLMRSLGYSVEAFPSAADFLAFPRLVETACLIADVHMPAMTGLELYRRLIDMGMRFLVTAYPDDDVRARALNDGSFATFASPLTRSISCGVLVRLSILMSRVKRIHELLSGLGKVN
jgi:FixJ family two-component response regulator